VHDSFGTNWRMLEMQAAIGRIQLRRIAEWTTVRTNAARRLREALEPFARAVRQPVPRDGLVHAYYRYYAYFRPEGLKPDWPRDRVIAALQARGVPVMHGTCSEVYLEKAFAGTGFAPSERLPVARELGETSIMFLVHPELEERHLDLICNAIADVFSKAAR
jgi:dTDP-4-amino-4,6-dideoxygalactose transaminase